MAYTAGGRFAERLLKQYSGQKAIDDLCFFLPVIAYFYIMWSPITDWILLHPERWRIIISGMPDEAVTVDVSRRIGYRRERRAHSHAELLFGLRGETVYGLGEAFYPVGPGTVMAFAPMELHQNGYPAFEPPVDHLWISLMHDGFTARRVRVRQGCMLSENVGASVYDALCLPPGEPLKSQADRKPEEPLELSLFRVRTLALNVVLALLDGDRRRGTTAADATQSRRRLIASIQRHLRRTAGRGDSLDSLARIAGYSRYHFHRIFQRETGQTVLAYINRCREQRVRECLARGETQKMIASELGFATPQAYSRWLRQHPIDAHAGQTS